jgi:hypothetical protein
MVDDQAAMGPIDRNLEALKRILATLVAMAGLSDNAGTLPRHLHLAVLRLLRPAEAATRRLIIALSRGIVVALPPQRPAKPKPGMVFLRNGVGPRIVGTGIINTGIPLHRLGLANVAPPLAPKPAASRPSAFPLAFPLLDPLRNPFRRPRLRRSGAVPRIVFDFTEQRAIPARRPPSLNDAIDATRLGRRLAALAAALGDMPAQARHFARWRARTDRLHGQLSARPSGGATGRARFRRIWPLRPGRPPGGRLSRFNPDARRLSRIREVDEVLAHAHALAVDALERPRPDTS